jgi:hypothetical protein
VDFHVLTTFGSHRRAFSQAIHNGFLMSEIREIR